MEMTTFNTNSFKLSMLTKMTWPDSFRGKHCKVIVGNEFISVQRGSASALILIDWSCGNETIYAHTNNTIETTRNTRVAAMQVALDLLVVFEHTPDLSAFDELHNSLTPTTEHASSLWGNYWQRRF